MVVNLNTLAIYHGTAVIYYGILTLENVDIAVNYISIFKILAPRACTMELIKAVINFMMKHNVM